jgi:hypothetical protein
VYPVETKVSLFISLIKRLNRKKKNVPMYGTRFCSITKLTVAFYLRMLRCHVREITILLYKFFKFMDQFININTS